MHRALEDAGYAVLQAEDGQVGLEMLEKQGADLVVTDIMMPERDGIETIREVHRACPETRIIAISGGGESHDLTYLRMAPAFGADAALVKPFRIGELIALVKQLLPQDACEHTE
jgi:DNA-binding response OmpR family regulator